MIRLESLVTWNQEIKLEESRQVAMDFSIIASKTTKFDIEIDDGRKINNYLRGASGSVFGWSDEGWTCEQNSSGRRIYAINRIDDKKFSEESIIKRFEEFFRTNYLITRDEHVSNERYHKFYGSSGMIWNLDLCNYTTGTHEEQFLQTLYDMEHQHPTIYRWTNAGYEFFKEYKNNEEFRRYYSENIQPIIVSMKDHATKKNMHLLVSELKKIPHAKKYLAHKFVPHPEFEVRIDNSNEYTIFLSKENFTYLKELAFYGHNEGYEKDRFFGKSKDGLQFNIFPSRNNEIPKAFEPMPPEDGEGYFVFLGVEIPVVPTFPCNMDEYHKITKQHSDLLENKIRTLPSIPLNKTSDEKGVKSAYVRLELERF